MSLVKWNDRGILPSMGSFFDDFFGDDDGFYDTLRLRPSMPPVNVSETETSFELEVAVPGLTKKDIKLEVENSLLTISSEKEDKVEKEEKNYTRKEYSYKSFKRSFRLPENVDPESVEAIYKEGVLTIVVQKLEKSLPNSRTIHIG